MKYTDIDINLFDICYIDQFKIFNCIILPKLSQWLEYWEKDASQLLIAMVFVKT